MDDKIIKKINEILDINKRLDIIKEKIIKNSFTEYKIISKNSNDKECSVCYCINFKYLKCNHNLCFECYNKWNKISIFNNNITKCPICKIPIT